MHRLVKAQRINPGPTAAPLKESIDTKLYLVFLRQNDYKLGAGNSTGSYRCYFPNGSTSTCTKLSGRALCSVPLSVAYAKKLFKKIPAEQGIDELFRRWRRAANLNRTGIKKSPSFEYISSSCSTRSPLVGTCSCAALCEPSC